MGNLKTSTGQIEQSGNFNYTGQLKKGGVDVPTNDTASLKAANETISGDKDYTGALKKDGVDLATVVDVAGFPAIPQSGGGELTANRFNEITDANVGYLFPLANSVAADIIMTVAATGPTDAVATRQGSDNIDAYGTIDTSITFEGPSPTSWASNGTDTWRRIA